MRYGITSNDIYDICKLVGITVLDILSDKLIVEVPTNNTPEKMVNMLKSELDDAVTNVKREKYVDTVKKYEKADSILYKYFGVAIIGKPVTGYGLLDILQRDDIDDLRTYSGNIHENVKIFGLLAAKNYLFLELYGTLWGIGSKIDPRHISILVDTMFRWGRPLGVNYVGVKESGTDPISHAAHQRPQESLSSAAQVGIKSKMNISSTVATGGSIRVGTGFSDYYIDMDTYVDTEEKVLQSGSLSPDMIDTYYSDKLYKSSRGRLPLSGNIGADLPMLSKKISVIYSDGEISTNSLSNTYPQQTSSSYLKGFFDTISKSVTKSATIPESTFGQLRITQSSSGGLSRFTNEYYSFGIRNRNIVQLLNKPQPIIFDIPDIPDVLNVPITISLPDLSDLPKTGDWNTPMTVGQLRNISEQYMPKSYKVGDIYK